MGLWNDDSNSAGYCALFDTACTSECPAPTNTAGGWFNRVYNKEFESAGENCNCGTRIAEWASGKETVALCNKACLDNADCASFGLWNDDSNSAGYCAFLIQHVHQNVQPLQIPP